MLFQTHDQHAETDLGFQLIATKAKYEERLALLMVAEACVLKRTTSLTEPALLKISFSSSSVMVLGILAKKICRRQLEVQTLNNKHRRHCAGYPMKQTE